MVKKSNLLDNFIIFIFLLMPFFSMSFFHNHLTTLFIVIAVIIIFLITIYKHLESRKNIKYLFGYFLLVFIYLIINYIRSFNFNSLIPNNYSLLKELLTIVKLMMPVLILYSLYYNQIDKKKYFFVINSWIFIITLCIISTNILKLSLSSYTSEVITYNIFEWKSNISYLFTASKGFFMYANQMAVLTIILLLISVYEFLYFKKRYFINLFLLMISMLMLGTRTSALGGLLVLAFSIIGYIIISVFNKEQIKYRFLTLCSILIMWIILLPISPFANRNIELNNYQNNVVSGININIDKNEKINYVYNHYNPNYLPKMFFEDFYKIEYDGDFWYEFIKKNENKNINYRFIEESIIKRMIEVNNNKFDILFGISNVRIQNVVNLERDFVLHFYAFGIIGSFILLLIYGVIFKISFVNLINNKNYFNFVLFSCVCLFLFIAFLTGNILNSLIPILQFSFLISRIFLIKKDEKNNSEIL